MFLSEETYEGLQTTALSLVEISPSEWLQIRSGKQILPRPFGRQFLKTQRPRAEVNQPQH